MPRAIRRDIPAVRILPMSEKREGFRGRSIEDVQKNLFQRELPAGGGCWCYPRVGLNAEPGTIVLFQYRARIIASAVFLRDEKSDCPHRRPGGAIYFEPASFRTFDPLDADVMRKIWPSFRAFGHVRQFLNPMRYPLLKRRLKNVELPKSFPTHGDVNRHRPNGLKK